MITHMKNLSAVLLPKAFHGLICIIYFQILITVIYNQYWLYFFRQELQPKNYLTLCKTTISLSYNMIRPMKYHRIDIQSKVFDGANCIPALYRLLKNCANIARLGTSQRLGNTKVKKKRCLYLW
jgi:hypothetical protein